VRALLPLRQRFFLVILSAGYQPEQGRQQICGRNMEDTQRCHVQL